MLKYLKFNVLIDQYILLFLLLFFLLPLINNTYANENSFNNTIQFNSNSSLLNTGIIHNNNERLTTIKSTFDVLYITPQHLDDVYNLNEKHTIGNDYNKGWILSSEEPISLNLYLYYDGHDETKLKQFIKNDLSNNTQSTATDQATGSVSTATLYLFFTPENNCDDYLQRNYWPFEIVERIASNMYRGKLSGIRIAYSSKPLHICMQQFDSDENIHDQYRQYSYQGDDYWVSIITTKSLLPTWARIILFIILLSLSGLFSGLNLGLMSLDLSELDILKRIGTPSEQSYASKIYPLRKRGNFLLCTILLGNVLVNSISTLILGDMLSGIYAAFGSTILIVIFGEIIPQSACSKHGLAVGAYTRYITYLFMVLTCPLSFPLSIVLNKVLGQEITATYSREKIREVMNVVEGLDDKEKKIISGALDFNNKKVREVMTKIDNVFMLELHQFLDFEAIAKIAQEGFSRIPVYESSKENIVGLLHVKDFTLLDPDDNMPVEALLKFYNHAVIFCDAEETIDERFEEFRKGETHLAFVNDVIHEPDKDPVKTCVGIVTLEDIIEELVQMEIYDEFDDKKEIEKEDNKTTKSNNDLSANPSLKEVFTENEKLLTNNNNDSALSKNLKGDIDEQNQNQSQNVNNQTINENNSSQSNQQNSTKSTEKSSIDLNSSNNSKKLNKLNKSNNSKPLYESQTSKDLSFFLQQQKDSSQRTLISPQIRFVMFQFLFTTVRPFTNEFLTKNVLELIFTHALFKESRRPDPKLPREYLYKYGKICNYFILILSGEATIEVGKEKLEFSAGPFAYFGANALLNGIENADQVTQEDLVNNIESDSSTEKKKFKSYIPDFSLRVDDKCVYMKIDRDLWKNGVIKSRLEKLNNQISNSIDYIPNEVNQATDFENNLKYSILDNNNIGSQMLLSHRKNEYPSGKDKRSFSLALNAFAKAQEVNNHKQNIEMNKLSNIEAKQVLNQVRETVDSLDDFNTSKNDYSFNLAPEEVNKSISIEIDEEKEPFINKKNSTTSLNVNGLNSYRKKSFTDKFADKYQTMSQKSFDHESDF